MSALKLTDFLHARKSLLHLQSEVRALRAENAELKRKNASMRQGMRRCVTCEYRLDYRQRQGEAPVLHTRPGSKTDSTSD